MHRLVAVAYNSSNTWFGDAYLDALHLHVVVSVVVVMAAVVVVVVGVWEVGGVL